MKSKKRNLILIVLLLTTTVLIVLALLVGLPVDVNGLFERLGNIGDFINGVVGTVIIFFGLWVAYSTLKETNSQTYQNTLALLLQSYHHTVEDYDYPEANSKVHTGREAIQKILDEFEKIIKEEQGEINLSSEKIKSFLTNKFPTHIPAIVVSILHSIDKNCPVKKNKKDLSKQIKSMLSYEERLLLLLFAAEQIANGDEDHLNDWPLIRIHIFSEGAQSKALIAVPGYVKMFNLINHRKQ